MRRAFVIGSGPNGLTAAVLLAREGYTVTVLEAQPEVGGGTRSAALTLPGFVHDVCSAVHPLAVSSPILATLPLKRHGLEWIHPEAPLAHPFDDGTCLLAERSIEQTAAQFGSGEAIYRKLAAPLVEHWGGLLDDALAPLHVPRHPLLLALFGALAAWPATTAARMFFLTPQSRGLFAGMAGHSIRPLESPGTAAFGWMFMLAAHAAGWPIPRGGSQSIADALASYLRSMGGVVLVNSPVGSLSELDPGAAIFCDVTPRQFAKLAAGRLPEGYRLKMARWRYGPGVFKIDWALSRPIPWRARGCARAATVHLGASLEEIAESERLAAGRTPFVLLAQPSLFDPTRAPSGQHTAWAYCHVANGSMIDMTRAMEAQVERFAPGFQECILARHSMSPFELEQHNANLVGGDIAGGANTVCQMIARPSKSFYRTPLRGVYLCSSSTPPGAGVHGMCGYWAVRAMLEDEQRSIS
jgi:phytoene dehydrogenase-like protein